MEWNESNTAKAYDNRVHRVAMILDTSRPFVALKPRGYFAPVIGHYATMKAAKQAAQQWNDNQGDRS